MPSLTTVVLDRGYAFRERRTAHTKSNSFSFPSFLDITSALQYYLSFPVSFTHYYLILCLYIRIEDNYSN